LFAPENCDTTLPLCIDLKVGTEATPACNKRVACYVENILLNITARKRSAKGGKRTFSAVVVFSSTSILTNRTSAPCFSDKDENTGAIALHGPHHEAVKYAKTLGDAAVIDSKVSLFSFSSVYTDEVLEKDADPEMVNFRRHKC
jgi:hypothetical protein